MLTYNALVRSRKLAHRVLGMDLKEFDALYAELEDYYVRTKARSKYTVRDHKKRRRRIGGGRHHKLDLRTRLLLYLFWIHRCPTQAVLAQMYDLSRGSIIAILNDIHRHIVKLPSIKTKQDVRSYGRIRTLAAVRDSFPEIDI